MRVPPSRPWLGIVRTVLIGAGLMSLAGCSLFSSKKPLPPCPPVLILSDAARITKFRPGPGRDLTDVESEAEIIAFTGGCTQDAKGITMDLQLGFDVKRGPAAQGRTTELTYFIAIPKFYPEEQAKAVFTLPVTFPAGVDQARVTDDQVTLRIPMQPKDTVDDYLIYLGFQTTPEELEMNRRLKR
jgi:hypothetical protein